MYKLLDKVRSKKPLVHHITNYVTVNDCANITLEIGASPVMADSYLEAADITAISGALVINMGTPNEFTAKSMKLAGKKANEIGIPVVFDPVGAGASKYRNDIVADIAGEVKLAVLRGNISEVKFVAGLHSQTKGVDASESDSTDLNSAGELAKELAGRLDCVVVISGAVDTVSDGERVAFIENGVPLLGNITGTGCMCSSLIGAFCGACPDDPLNAAIAAMACMGIAGEIASEKVKENGSFRVALHDAISQMDVETLQRMVRCG